MQERIEALKRVVQAGLNNGKKNLIVDLEILAVLLQIYRPTYCEHFISEGEWCEDFNPEINESRIENGNA